MTPIARNYIAGLLAERIADLRKLEPAEYAEWTRQRDAFDNGNGQDPLDYEAWGLPRELAMAERVQAEFAALEKVTP